MRITPMFEAENIHLPYGIHGMYSRLKLSSKRSKLQQHNKKNKVRDIKSVCHRLLINLILTNFCLRYQYAYFYLFLNLLPLVI